MLKFAIIIYITRGNVSRNVRLRRHQATILKWKNDKYYIFWVHVCSLICTACKAHSPYCVVFCRLSGSTMFFFSTLSYEPLAFREKLLNIKCAFWFSLQLLSETFFILRRNERNYEMRVHRFSRKVPVIHVKFYL